MQKYERYWNFRGIGYFLIITLSIGGYLVFSFTTGDKSMALPGQTTLGHHQFEENCESCHTSFKGVQRESCVKCHSAELKAIKDSHPAKKFNNPKVAGLLKNLNVQECTTCHQEHRPEITGKMGVTLPRDFCIHCHANISKKRVSHKEFDFNSCSNSGCHNYHDNTSLNEDVMMAYAGDPDIAEEPVMPLRNLSEIFKKRLRHKVHALKGENHDAPAHIEVSPEIVTEWERSGHARSGVNCSGCHVPEYSEARDWKNELDQEACLICHETEVKGFLGGMHGMRLDQNMSPMQVNMAQLPMKEEAGDKTLTCESCHKSHAFGTQTAAVEACLSCHNDSHSLAYEQSPHFQLWKAEQADQNLKGKGVSCATCHLPRESHYKDGMNQVQVQHNQSVKLRPNDKMIQSVCLNCHGLEFSLNSLADDGLIKNNFRGKPSVNVKSVKMAEDRMMED